jgi:hypothetical protein
MIDYIRFVKPHLGKSGHAAAIESDWMMKNRLAAYGAILARALNVSDVVERQVITVDEMLKDLPTGLRVTFSADFREVTISDANGKVLVSGRGIDPEAALFHAYYKYWTYVKEEVPKIVSAGAKGLPKKKAPESKKKVVV